MDSLLHDTISRQIGERGAYVATSLADAAEQVGRSRPEMVTVGPWSLVVLKADDHAMHSADQARRDAESIETPGRGYDVWHARPGLIKFGFTEPLAAAYRATGDAGYARAFRVLLEDFFASLRSPKWAGGGMRLSQRIGRWGRYLPYFLDAEAFDDGFVQRVVDHVPEQLASILRTHKVTSRGNIRMLETTGMFWAAMGFPMVEGVEAALERVRWVIADTAEHAVYSDGSYQEYDPNYLGVFRGAFYEAMWWRAAFPDLDLPDVSQATARLFDYALASKSPIGHPCGMQESLAPWIGDRDCGPLLQQRSEVRRLAGLEENLPPWETVCSAASQGFLRTGWDREAMFAGFDASRWGGAHSHLARNSVLLFGFGRALLADTGALSYSMGHKKHEGDELDQKMGPYGKSTRAHNTLNLNGWNQAPTNPDQLRGYFGEGFSAVIGKYSGGYWPGPYGWWFSEGFGAGVYGTHERMLFWIPGRFIVTVDCMMRWDESTHGHGAQQHPSREMNWQLSPGGRVDINGDGLGFTAVYPEGGLCGHFAKLAAGMSLAKYEGESDPPRGWITTRSTQQSADLRRMGVFDEAPGSEWTNRSYMPAPQISGVANPMQGFGESIVSVFVPFVGQTPPTFDTEVGGAIADPHPFTTAGSLTVRWGDGSRDDFAWSDSLLPPLFDCHLGGLDLRTDANAVHLRFDAGRELEAGAALNASRFEAQGLSPASRERIRVGSHMQHTGGF